MDLPRRSGVVCGEYVLRTSHFDTAEPPEALADAARYRSSPDGRECTPGRNRSALLRLSARSRRPCPDSVARDRKSTRLNSSHEWISYAVFCLKKNNSILQA